MKAKAAPPEKATKTTVIRNAATNITMALSMKAQ